MLEPRQPRRCQVWWMLDNLPALKVLGFVLMEFVHPTARKAMHQIMPVLLVAWKGPGIFFGSIFLGVVKLLLVVLLAIDGMLMVIVFVLSWHFSLSSFGKLWLLFFDDSQRFWVLCLSAPCFEVHQMVPICCHWAIPALQFGWMKLQWMSLAIDQRITNLPPLPQHLILGFWWGGQSSLFFSPRKNSGRRRSTEEPEMVVVSKLTPKLLVGNTR